MDGKEPKPIVPLRGRYPSKEMKDIFPKGEDDYRDLCSAEMRTAFCDESKYLGWRRIWVVLAEEEQRLGLPFTDDQIAAVRKQEKVIDYERAKEIERKTKHDTMSYLTEFKEQANKIHPGAGGILHAGGTSCTITDNEELAAMKNGLKIVRDKIYNLKETIEARDLCRNSCAANLEFVLGELDYRIKNLKARGIKGTTGTQASYLELFDGDHEKVKTLDERVSQALGFEESYTITGQTYPRIVDYQMLSSLGLVAEVLKSIAPLMCSSELLKELNHVQDCAKNAAQMASTQWLERSLDDSSERRIIIPEAFYALDYVINDLIDSVKSDKEKPKQAKESKTDKKKEKLKLIEDESSEAKGLQLITKKLANTVDKLHTLAEKHEETACTAYTHYQFAQPTTYGKRIALWNYSFVLALNDTESSMKLPVENSGLIYHSARNYLINSKLNQVAIAAAKMAYDIRLLQHDLEINEPFGISQVGSSAMAYKKNPMKCERIDGLARVVIGLLNMNKEPDYKFLGTDAILELVLTTLGGDTEKQKGFTVHEKAARANLMRFMPFLATENLLMDAVKKGGDRQELHEVVRLAMLDARANVDEGRENNMLELLAQTGKFDIDLSKKSELLDPMKYLGRCREQVEEFGQKEVGPIRERYASSLGIEGNVKV